MAACAGKIASLVCSITGALLAILVWLAITYCYRDEKCRVIKCLLGHIAVSDITSNNATAATAPLSVAQAPLLNQPVQQVSTYQYVSKHMPYY